MEITVSDLRGAYDFSASHALVRRAIADSLADGPALLRFIGRYISWNGWFGGGVSELAAKIARGRDLFVDPQEPIAACADRSNHVGSYIFDAARDEFDDSATPYRDTHRTLAQATIRGVAEYYGLVERADELLAEPAWLTALNRRVGEGYGLGTPDTPEAVFGAMGYHMGSEILADEEFTILDKTLRERKPKLVDHLLQHRVRVADAEHAAYYWIGIHSGLGGGVEMEHFEWALGGVREGLRFVEADRRAALREAAMAGFRAFAADHTEFFEKVSG